MDNQEYIQKWLNGSLSEAELRVFEQTQDFESVSRLDKVLPSFKAPEFDVQGELSRLKERKRSRARVVQFNWSQTLLRVAAVVVMVILGYFLISNDSKTTIETGIAEKTELNLPDASTVMLNASSSITFNEEEWDAERIVELRGEAYFKVAKGARFEVKTGTGVVTVLGTQFNVKVRDNYFEVICYEGLVAVNSSQGKVKLPPNNMFRIIDGKVYTNDNLNESAPSWTINESSFTSVPFDQVIKEFARQYDVSITTNEVDLGQLFTGRFTHSDITLALKSISLPLNLRYELEDDQHIVLTGDID
jgi:ferric-dicitrate binding protein FerR (iron transport regulator)